MIKKCFIYMEYIEDPIFLQNRIKFIPKGYYNCQLSIVNCQFDISQFAVFFIKRNTARKMPPKQAAFLQK